MTSNVYDELPYESSCIPTTSPEGLVTLTRMKGLSPPCLQGARLLEIGCGDAGNVLPLAYYHPDWEVVGIDPSTAAIEKGKVACQQLGLKNLELSCQDVREFRAQKPFDFILCHGVYSWVAADVRQAILQLASDSLAPNGLFYVSYNTEPGWRVRGLVRERLRAARQATSLAEATQQAKQHLLALSEQLDGDESHPYIALLRRELQFADRQPLFHLAHEYLAEHNEAFWFGAVVEAAESHQLEYVGDAQRYTPEGFVATEQRQAAQKRFDTLKAQEEHLDLLRYRQLRASVFTRQNQRHTPDPLRVIASSTIVSALRQVGDSIDLTESKAETFICPTTKRQIPVDTRIGKAALLLLGGHYPRGLSLDELLQSTKQLLEHEGHDPNISQDEIDDLIQGLHVLHEHALIGIRPTEEPAPFPRTEQLPIPHALALYEASNRAHLSTPWHHLLPFDPIDKALIDHLGKGASRDELIARAEELGSEDARSQLAKVCAQLIQWGLCQTSHR